MYMYIYIHIISIHSSGDFVSYPSLLSCQGLVALCPKNSLTEKCVKEATSSAGLVLVGIPTEQWFVVVLFMWWIWGCRKWGYPNSWMFYKEKNRK